MFTDAQLLSQFRGIDRSIESMRQAILTLCQQNIELLRIIGNLQSAQLQAQLQKPSLVNPDLAGLPIYLASFLVRNKGEAP